MKFQKTMQVIGDIPTAVWLAGAGVGWLWWKSRPVDQADTRGLVDRVTDVIFPLDKCAAAMNAGDAAGAAWHCRPATFAAWLTNGKPKGCSVLEDGKISCPAASTQKRTGATGTW